VDALNDQVLGGYKRFVEQKYQALTDMCGRLEAIARDHDLLVVAEVQEKTDMAERRKPRVGELLAEATHMVFPASHVIRIWRVPGDESIAEAQVIASRFANAGWSIPLIFCPGDMYVKEGDMSMLQRIDALCATRRAE